MNKYLNCRTYRLNKNIDELYRYSYSLSQAAYSFFKKEEHISSWTSRKSVKLEVKKLTEFLQQDFEMLIDDD